ncbi:MAG: glycoside hydrolase family 127 protein [Clostridia bacterium]|nr:glycoside hydrolase family 127 protein [Clostridia bacterium]
MNKLTNLNFENVEILGGFWKWRYDLNREVSLRAVYERFEESGRFDALRFNFREGKEYPHIFYDSDTAKWIEAVGYLITRNGGYEKEQKIIDDLVADMEKNQLPDGYLNSHYIQIEPNRRFTDRSAHELYCAGHLIEAAIAYDKATGKHDFLSIMKKYVDCIERYFVTDKLSKFSTCGHEEIEIALLKLFEYTGEKKYLDLAMFFIDQRGVCGEEGILLKVFNRKYDQSEIAVRELSEAEGHSVRAAYLYTAMAEAALKTGDTALLDACRRIWRNMVDKKMYVTGGIGSDSKGESFTVAYDLPNLEAYSESCAAIGLVFFALAMQKNELNPEYGAVIERVMYNGVLSSTSLDGKSFFYVNPLEIHLASVDKQTAIQPYERMGLPLRQRAEVFGCSCCPPNINRFFARIGDVFFSQCGDSFVINQYGAVSYSDDKTSLKMTTDYPCDGKILLEIDKCGSNEILLRIPEWCDEYSVNAEHTEKNGYISVPASVGKIEIDFKMEPYFVECNPSSRNNNGRVALCRGPVVYCVERVDNDYELNALAVDVSAKVLTGEVDDTYGMRSLKATAFLDRPFESLYRKVRSDAEEVELSFRPYWTFANRGESDMLVWVRKK